MLDDESIKSTIKEAISQSKGAGSELRELILILLVVGLIIGIFSSLGKDDPGCWKLQQINDHIVKVNSCSGKVKKLQDYEKKAYES